MKFNTLYVVVAVIVSASLICIISEKMKKETTTTVDETKINVKVDKSSDEINKIEYDDFDKQFMNIPISLKRKLEDYEAMNYYGDRPADILECTQKQVDKTTKCKDATMLPSFQTTPEIPDGVFMEGQEPVCHIDRVRAIEDFSCPVKHNKKISDPCKYMCRHCVVGVCEHGICN